MCVCERERERERERESERERERCHKYTFDITHFDNYVMVSSQQPSSFNSFSAKFQKLHIAPALRFLLVL